MPLYEVMCITTIAAPHKSVVNTLRRVHSAITERGGLVRGIEHLGVRPLAYRMRAHLKWNTTGRYLRFFLQASPAALAEVEHRLKVDEDVVRYLVLKRKLAPSGPEKALHYRSDAVFPAGEVAFHRKHSHLDYFAARELLRKGVITPEQVKSGDFKNTPGWAPAVSPAQAAAAAAYKSHSMTSDGYVDQQTLAPPAKAAVSTAATTGSAASTAN